MMKSGTKKNSFRIAGFLAAAFLALYIPSVINWIFGTNIQTELLQNGEMENSINSDAVILRNEEVIKSPLKGSCITQFNDGDKVSNNERVALILKDTSQKLLEQLNSMDLNILKVQKEKNSNQELFSEDIKKLDTEIEQKLTTVVNQANNGSVTGLKDLKEDINGLVRKKAVIAGSLSTSDTYLNTLKKERDNIQEQINSGTKEIVSAVPGIISYNIDGYETILRFDSIKELTPEFIDGIKVSEVRQQGNSFPVEADRPFAKLVPDMECMLAVPVDEQRAQNIKTGDVVSVRINDINKVVDGTIAYKGEPVNGRQVVAVKVNHFLSDTVTMRKVNVDIILGTYEGLKVPVSCLRDISSDGTTASIVLVKAYCASIRQVRINGKNNDFAVIQSLEGAEKKVNLYDTFVLDPQNIVEGQEIK